MLTMPGSEIWAVTNSRFADEAAKHGCRIIACRPEVPSATTLHASKPLSEHSSDKLRGLQRQSEALGGSGNVLPEGG